MMPAVRRTAEYDRVAAIPRRVPSDRDAAAWAQVLTEDFAVPGSGSSLRPWQAYSLAEVAEVGGGFLCLSVGAGKTLIMHLLPQMLGVSRTVIIMSAALREKTWADFASYRGRWRSPEAPPTILGREELAREGNAKLLEQYRPQLIILEEADEFANYKSSACRRIDRWKAAHPETIIVSLTGTPSRKSIMGYWHLLYWGLGDGAPIPLNEGECKMWAAALDKKAARFEAQRPCPGPLGRGLKSARAWFRQRLLEAPGVVIVDGDSCDQPLTVRVRLARESAEIDAHFQRFLDDGENPDGVPVTDPLSRWRLDSQLGSGVVLYWDPPPPERWAELRRASAKLCRETIEASQRTSAPIETEAQAIRRLEMHPVIGAWLRIRCTFKPRTKARWLDTSTLDSVRDWLGQLDRPGIVWCGTVEFAERLARETKLPYYGPKGRAQNGTLLHQADPKRSMICSWNANKKGFNLQAWPRQLICQPPQSAKWLEQIIGRSHRSGQEVPVIVDVLATSGGTLDGFEEAFSEARFAKSTISLTQKILRARIVRASPTITNSNRFRWAKRSDKKE